MLSRRRPVGFGIGSIPLPEIESFFRLHGIEEAEVKRLYLTVIEALDAEHLRLLEKEKPRG